jgi:hypothetical protein
MINKIMKKCQYGGEGTTSKLYPFHPWLIINQGAVPSCCRSRRAAHIGPLGMDRFPDTIPNRDLSYAARIYWDCVPPSSPTPIVLGVHRALLVEIGSF